MCRDPDHCGAMPQRQFDDLGLPVEGDAGDFARAFSSVRAIITSPALRAGEVAERMRDG
jgi:hypothetical protein